MAVVLGGGLLILGLQGSAVGVSSIGPGQQSPADLASAEAPAGVGLRDAASVSPPDRIAQFQSRLAAVAPIQASLWRAFHPASVPALAARARPRAVRVAQGATPQACLAQAVYYEARGEPRDGQAAVAQVVLNRARSGAHPASVCGVVFEGAARSGCQFSFACDGRLGRSHVEPVAWRRAEAVAADALGGREVASLQTALNYHADYVRPRWAAQLQRTAEIGRHVFYAAWSPVSRTLNALAPPPPPPPPAAAE